MKRLPLLGLVLLLSCMVMSCKTKEEKLQEAEEDGQMLVQEPSKMLKGAGDALKKEGKEAAESITEGAGELVKGITSGFDKSMTKVDVKMAEGLEQKLTLGGVRKEASSDENGYGTVSAFIDPIEDLKGVFTLKAFDAEGVEIGRSKYGADIAAGDAMYHDFKFDERTPMMQVANFELSFE